MRRLPSVVRSPKYWTQNQAVFFQLGGTIKVSIQKRRNQKTFKDVKQILPTETESKTLGQVTGVDLRAQSSGARSRFDI